MTEPQMRRVPGEGVELQLAVWPGTEKTILCLHGLTANCRWWDTLAAKLAPPHQVLAMDLRGRGLSQQPATGYSLAQHCQDILAVLDHLGLERVVLMGHSLGAFIALRFAACHADRVERLILIDGGGKLSEAQTLKVLAGIKPTVDRLGRVFASFAAYLEHLQQVPALQPWLPGLEIPYCYEVEEVPGGVCSRVQVAHIHEEIVNLAQEDAAAYYPRLGCPVLLLRATQGMLAADDLLLPEDVVQHMLREIAWASSIDVPDCNHYTIVFKDLPVRDQALRAFIAV